MKTCLYDGFVFLVVGTHALLSDRIDLVIKIMVVMKDPGRSDLQV
jgi:RecG-like helicase